MSDNEVNAVPAANDTTSSGSSTGPAAGPLVVSETNPRYFTLAASDVAHRRAVYLTGSHVNNNFHDGSGPGADCAQIPEPNDFRAYLGFLKERGHNFIRLWRWEQFRSQVAGGAFHLCMTPQPWPRSGPGKAKDGKPKFDLSVFEPAYFERLREYVAAAANEGIYVSVMFFEGFGLHLSLAPDNVEGHPFHAANNVNEIGITSINDYQVLPLDPRVQALQEAYIRKVIDTVQDLPNVLYEVANESSGGGSVEAGFVEAIGLSGPPDWGDSTQWQYWVIDFLKRYEAQMGYARHPVGMTMQYPVGDQSKVNEVLFESLAEWISPGFDDVESPMHSSRWYTDPPANDGAKVIISDTDHYSPMKSEALWAWKSFLRGHNPILYDLGIISGVDPADPSSGSPSFASLEPARHAMGDTLRFAREMDLIAMEPRSDLSSTGYALANPGEEYLVLQPDETADLFAVRLEANTYSIRWHSVVSRETKSAGEGQYGEGDEFIGVRMGQISALAKDFIEMTPGEIEELLESPVHEVRAGALSIMDKQGRSNRTPESRRKELFDLYLRRTDRVNNWDLVDLGAPYVVGRYLFGKPRDVLRELARSENVWERRTAIVSTSYFIRQGDLNDTFEIAEILLGDYHDLIHKATGGWLREAGKKDRQRLLRFLDGYAATMPRTMLRYSIEHLHGEQRAHYLSLKQATEAGQDRGGDRS